MAGDDHRSHMALMDRKDLLEPTFESTKSCWNCNSKGCGCRGGEKRFLNCNSDYWSKLGFKLYKEVLNIHTNPVQIAGQHEPWGAHELTLRASGSLSRSQVRITRSRGRYLTERDERWTIV